MPPDFMLQDASVDDAEPQEESIRKQVCYYDLFSQCCHSGLAFINGHTYQLEGCVDGSAHMVD